MTFRIMWIKGKKYYLYDKYETKQQAVKEANRWKKRNKCRRIIIKAEHRLLEGDLYYLYLDKCVQLWP